MTKVNFRSMAGGGSALLAVHLFLYLVLYLVLYSVLCPVISSAKDDATYGLNKRLGLDKVYVYNYDGGKDGGLAHVTYWGLPAADPEYHASLPPQEQAKAEKINRNILHSKIFQPSNSAIAGTEMSGLLRNKKRIQSFTFRLPDNWNGKLMVAGTPGLRNEYANEAVLVPWLLEAGYAYIAGDKGIPRGVDDMTSGGHPSQHWGMMMMDLAKLGRGLLKAFEGQNPNFTYAIGLSNGGYQTRRALEIDHKRVLKGKRRLFNGGVDWSGAYWPDKRVLDADGNGKVSVSEYAAAHTLIGASDKGTLAMGWFYSQDSLTTPEEYSKVPKFAGAYFPMIDSGYSAESAMFWGYYNTIFDGFQNVQGFEKFRGVGYYNLISYAYRADLRGDDGTASAEYSCYWNPDAPEEQPPLYRWLSNAENGGWNKESIIHALKNSNSGSFSVPLLSLHGQNDGLLGTISHGLAYKDAVALNGSPDLHRLYIIANAGHVDKNADGGWGYSLLDTDNTIPDRLTPIQAYAQRTLRYLEHWVESGVLPPVSKFVETDPANDIIVPDSLEW